MSIIIFQILILIFSIVIHEISHGYMAYHLGDPTAKRAGRLTLNPIKHLDLFGSIIVPGLLLISGSGFVIGWAKPVPYNPNLLIKDKKYGPLKVALAGPLSNLLIAFIFGFGLRFLHPFLPSGLIFSFAMIAFINILLAIFNLIPMPPLDGSKILMVLLPPKYADSFERVGIFGLFLVFILISLFGGVLFGIVSGLFKLISGSEVWGVFITILSQGL